MTPALLKTAIERGTIKTRADAALEYALVIAVDVQRGDDDYRYGDPDIGNQDIGWLNSAIIERWSHRDLDWIKRRGWKLFKANGKT